MRLGALEAGGTKMVCAVGNEKGEVEERVSIPTKTPEETMPAVFSFFRDKGIEAFGIACFGPVDLDPQSDTYGWITTTPKTAWRNFDMAGAFSREFSVPVGFDTDVNGAVYGEAKWGAAKDVDSCIYMTVGTGIGVGVLVNGKPYHGLMHPEAGHVIVRRAPDDSYAGNCPYHDSCLEGLASGPAIRNRWGKDPEELQENRKVWELEAYYLGQAIADYILILSPKRVVLGGGVMHTKGLLKLVQREVLRELNGYLTVPAVTEKSSEYIVASELSDNQGVLGCFLLAEEALQKERKEKKKDDGQL